MDTLSGTGLNLPMMPPALLTALFWSSSSMSTCVHVWTKHSGPLTCTSRWICWQTAEVGYCAYIENSSSGNDYALPTCSVTL